MFCRGVSSQLLMRSRTRVIRSPDRAIRELRNINNSLRGPDSVKVGLPKGANDYPDGTSVTMVGAVHEFGSPSRNVPERSFLRSTVQEQRKPYKRLFAKLAKKIIQGKLTKKDALQLIGLQTQTDVREKITDLQDPPLVSREGNPLVDTGHLRQSIVYEVQE